MTKIQILDVLYVQVHVCVINILRERKVKRVCLRYLLIMDPMSSFTTVYYYI